MTKYRIIEPARPHPSFGNVDRIERYLYGGGGSRLTLMQCLDQLTSSYGVYTEPSPIRDFGRVLRFYGIVSARLEGDSPRISDVGRIQGVSLSHSLWQGHAYVIDFGGIVTTIEPSYLDARIHPQPPAIGGRE